MGEIYRAIDQHSGSPVAIKMLRPSAGADGVARFRREVAVLADLRHPNIVQYLDHGVWPGGRPYLAMEWLEGEDLESRFKREALGLRDSVELIRRAAAALAAVHARGVVHRDLKLSNIWLCDERTYRVKLIDFGVVKLPEPDEFSTRAGEIVGTPYHMAPEQARNGEVTPRADVYSLGSVLFLLVTGRLVFPTQHLVALLGQLVLEDAPLASMIRPDIPAVLDQLIARCLARDPLARPADAGELARALARVGDLDNESPEPVVLLRPKAGKARSLGTGAWRLVATVLASIEQASLPPGVERALTPLLRPGDHLEIVRGERLVLALGLERSEGDEVLRAARAALLITRLIPGARVGVASGQVQGERGLSLEALERAAVHLEKAAHGGVRVDEVTVPLLAGRFLLREDAEGATLLQEDESGGRGRQLLGRPTPMVGRERELDRLLDLYREVVLGRDPQGVLVVGAAGVGKSRLRYELGRRLPAEVETPDLLLCRGDPVSERGGLSCLGRALRARLGVLDGEPPLLQEHKLDRFLEGRVRLGLDPAHGEFLGELAGVRRSQPASDALRAARQSPALLLGRAQAAVEALVRAEERLAPQIFVLEDLTWTDDLTRGVCGALLGAADLRFFLVAFARPEIDAAGPIWQGRPVARLDLRPLSPADAARLVDLALPGVPEETRSAIVDRAGGNALFLEELTRHAAEGRSDLPLSVISLVQARLDGLPPRLGAVARAASIFGMSCWSAGVAALVGEPVGEALESLATAEILGAAESSRVAGDSEWRFRHSLVRDAIYSSLLDEDRATFHGLAMRWLESMGETDLALLGWHAELSGDRERAVEIYGRATAQAHEAGQYEAVLSLTEAALALTADQEPRGRLCAARAGSLLLLGRYAEAVEVAQIALDLSPPGSVASAEAARIGAAARRDLGQQEESVAWLGAAITALPPRGDRAIRSRLLAEQARTLADLGRLDEARSAAEQAMTEANGADHGQELARLGAVDARFFVAAMEGRLARQIELSFDVVHLADAAGDLALGTRGRVNLGSSLNRLGRFEEAREVLARAVNDARATGTLPLEAYGLHNLGLSLARLGRIDEAIAQQQQARGLAGQMGHERLLTATLQYEALTVAWGPEPDLHGALVLARQGLVHASQQPSQRATAVRVLSFIQALRGAHEASLELLGEASIGSASGGLEWDELARLTLVQVLIAVGEIDEASVQLRRAHRRLCDRGRALHPSYWPGYLDGIGENHRLLQMASEWLGLAPDLPGYQLPGA
jgi:tetratricopeptide (TPR) repeat protein